MLSLDYFYRYIEKETYLFPLNVWRPPDHSIYSLNYIFRLSRGVLHWSIGAGKLLQHKANRCDFTSSSHLRFILSERGLCMSTFQIVHLSGFVSVSTCWQPFESVLQCPFQSRCYATQSCPTRNTWIWHFIRHEY